MSQSPPSAPLRLLVATPLYGGAEGDYLRSVVGLTGAAERAGVPCAFAWLSNNPVIDRARNLLAAAFLKSDATHLVFIDGDVGFVPEELLGLAARMAGDDRLAVVGAPYPKRAINWRLVASGRTTLPRSRGSRASSRSKCSNRGRASRSTSRSN